MDWDHSQVHPCCLQNQTYSPVLSSNTSPGYCLTSCKNHFRSTIMWLQATRSRHRNVCFHSIGNHQPSVTQLSPFPCPVCLPFLELYLPREAYNEREDERSSFRRMTATKQSQAGALHKSRHGRGNRHMASFVMACMGSRADFLQMCVFLDQASFDGV